VMVIVAVAVVGLVVGLRQGEAGRRTRRAAL